jgi:hypothetical protein
MLEVKDRAISEVIGILRSLRRRLFPTRMEQLGRDVERAWDQGFGVDQAAFDIAELGSDDVDLLVKEALDWLDRAVYTSRTPYGISGFSLQMALANGADVLCIKRLQLFVLDNYGDEARGAIAERLRREAAGTDAGKMVLTLLRVGDAVEAVLYPSGT